MPKHEIAMTAPHEEATRAGMAVLEQGGSAIEAIVAAAAMISVVYPHMTGIGGDGFWLIDQGGKHSPIGIDAAGCSASAALHYPSQHRGGQTALTSAATLKGWELALKLDQYRTTEFKNLLAPAIHTANTGLTVTDSLSCASAKLLNEEGINQSFIDTFSTQGQPLKAGSHFTNPRLAATLNQLANKGINDFYQGEIAACAISTLNASGSPLCAKDLQATQAQQVSSLSAEINNATLFNFPAPTQGISSLLILALADRLRDQVNSEAELVHLLIEATKLSFIFRDKQIADPAFIGDEYKECLTNHWLTDAQSKIDLNIASPWPIPAKMSDTVWMGAVDRHGQMVSFIQSIYHEFGSGIAIEDTGFVWHNRALGFDDDPTSPNCLAPNKKPRHTLNPALAHFADGRKLIYGTMGGEGQPQTQAAIFARFAWQGLSLKEAISQGRWLLGRTWGDSDNDLKLEKDLADRIADQLKAKKHCLKIVENHNQMMGHAGAIATLNGKVIDKASDPRSDGLALST